MKSHESVLSAKKEHQMPLLWTRREHKYACKEINAVETVWQLPIITTYEPDTVTYVLKSDDKYPSETKCSEFKWYYRFSKKHPFVVSKMDRNVLKYRWNNMNSIISSMLYFSLAEYARHQLWQHVPVVRFDL